ncbi:MAG: hypothetical protein IPK80_34655 [Nannocystis sp.]|nr:hypothetical protein [Nannocystis sp.]
MFDTVASMLFHAKENSVVRIAIAGWYQAEPMLSAIRFAVECKKCTVYMVAPPAISGEPQWFQMKADWPHTKAIDSLLGPRIVHWTGNGAGISSNISHNKFATFSQLDSAYSHATNVVVQQSNNWIGGLDPLSPGALGNDTHRPNDMLIVRNNPNIYRAYRDFFGALWASANKTPHPVFVGSSYRQKSDAIQAFFFGNGAGIISDPDPRLSLIQSVLPDTAIVHVAMGTWTNSGHGNDVYDALQTLRSNGGQVYCLMNPSEGKVDLKKADISHASSHTHSKYMLIEGRWINEHGRAGFNRYVVAGSYNFQSPGMADALIQVRNDPMTYFAYLDNWYGLCFNSWSPYKFPCGGGEGEGGGQYP